MGHHHEIAVRYGEVDLQRVVFNAHYLAYVDDAMDHWMRELDADFEALGWDFMLKRAEVDWHGAAGLGDLIEIESSIVRWGTTSFVVDHQLHVGDRHVVSVRITYVGVEAGTVTTMAAPDRVRAHLGEPSGDGG
jgi:acyl-CoA thioester hydrolase